MNLVSDLESFYASIEEMFPNPALFSPAEKKDCPFENCFYADDDSELGIAHNQQYKHPVKKDKNIACYHERLRQYEKSRKDKTLSKRLYVKNSSLPCNTNVVKEELEQLLLTRYSKDNLKKFNYYDLLNINSALCELQIDIASALRACNKK